LNFIRVYARIWYVKKVGRVSDSQMLADYHIFIKNIEVKSNG